MKCEKETPGRIVIEDNTIYEIDLECVRKKREAAGLKEDRSQTDKRQTNLS
ncbi:MAG: hypothetical protein J6I65_01010 [Lachnospiraceae bacterium]|nr:hypothetical protein [Lachnospiraceae bacterium]